MKLGRKLTAPLSAVFLIIIAGLAFTYLQAKPEYPPLILDPQFELWVSAPDLGSTKPLVWGLEYVKGAGDQVALRESVVADRKALEIQIFQDGVDDKWAYVYLSQMIDGERLRALFREELRVWIFSEASCACEGTPPSQSTVFGVETNDETHTLTFIFSRETAEPQQFLTHRTVFLQTPPGQWTYHAINVSKQYTDAHWNLPERLSFSIILGAPGYATGMHVGYVNGFTWTAKTTTTPTQEKNLRPSLLSSTCSGMPFTGDQRTGSPCWREPTAAYSIGRATELKASQGFNQ